MNRAVFFVMVICLSGCVSFLPRRVPEVPKANLSLIYQSNRQGQMEPCGCGMRPFGGLDREFNAIERVRADSEVLFVDGGNMLAPHKMTLELSQHQKKATALVEMLNLLGLDVFAPGPLDYALGSSFLMEVSRKARFLFVSSNVTGSDGKTLFSPYLLLRRANAIFAFISLIPGESQIEGAKVLDPVDTANELVKGLKGKADVIIAFSPVPTRENESIAQVVPGVDIWVGSDGKSALNEPFLLSGGRSLLVDGHSFGYQVGKLDLSLQLPLTGFYSEDRTIEKQNELRMWEERLLKNTEDDVSKAFIERFKSEETPKDRMSRSTYQNLNIALDKKRFGKKNIITSLIGSFRRYSQGKKRISPTE